MNTEQVFGQIDRAAFAAENAAASAEIAARNGARVIDTDTPAINQLAHELATAGIPKAAAGPLAVRIIKLQRQPSGVSREFELLVQRLEGRVIQLEREVAQLRNVPAHLRDVERRG